MDLNEERHQLEDEDEPFIEINEGLVVVAVACVLLMLAVAGALVIGEQLWGNPYKALETPTLMDKYR